MKNKSSVYASFDKKQKFKLLFWVILVAGIAAFYLLYTGYSLNAHRRQAEAQWEQRLNASPTPPKHYISKEDSAAVSVYASTYINSIDSVDIRQSEFSVTFDALFCFDNVLNPDFDMEDNFRIYNGKITDMEKIQDYQENGMRYQMFRVSAAVKEIFSTKRFPLSSYQIRFYIQPKESMEKIHMRIMDKSYAGSGSQLNVPGFELLRTDIANYYYEVPNPERFGGNSSLDKPVVYSEILTCIELNRSSWGLYLKCTISLLGVSIWAFLCLFVCVYHKTETFGMLPPVLFGVVSNILVGASLVPDALETGLLEYINIWGIYAIIIVAVIVVNVAHIRRHEGNELFAGFFGRILFAELLITISAGYIIIPASAYRW